MSLATDLRRYLFKNDKFYPPYMWKKFDVSPETLTKAICQIWSGFPQAGVKDGYVYASVPTKQWVYEVCDTKYQRGSYVNANDVHYHLETHRKKDQHISIVAHDKAWRNHVAEHEKAGGVRDSQVKLNELYIELDRKYDVDPIRKACRDAFIIKQNPNLEGSVAYYSGNSSIHLVLSGSLFGNPIGNQHSFCGRGKLIYNLQHMVVKDIRYGNGLIDVWQTPEEIVSLYHEAEFGYTEEIQAMRQRLENVDPNLCSVNSLIRAPLSYHEKSNRQKVPLTDAELLSMKFPSNQKIYVAPKKTKPYLLHWYYEAIEPTSTPIKRIEVKDKNLVIQTFVEHLEYFDPTLANVDGWVNDLYSPFYKDGNPSVGVNIETGMYKDFGNPADTMNFIAFFARVKQITYQEAKTIIEL